MTKQFLALVLSLALVFPTQPKICFPTLPGFPKVCLCWVSGDNLRGHHVNGWRLCSEH